MTTTDVPPLQVTPPVSEGRWVQEEQVAPMIDMNRLRELTAEVWVDHTCRAGRGGSPDGALI